MPTHNFAFAYYFAYVLAAPICALIIGVNLNQAYCSRLSRSSRWSTHALASFCLMFIASMVVEIYTAIEQENGPLVKFLKQPTPSQMLIPISIGCVEFLVQACSVKPLLRTVGKSVFAILSISICFLNFLVSWGCAINILINLNHSSTELVNPADLSLPSLSIGIKVFKAWLATSAVAGLAIFGSRLYSSRQASLSGQGQTIRFLRNDTTITKMGVISLQTSALGAILITVISLIFMINELTEDKTTPIQSGSFVFLNLMRVPVSCSTFAFTTKRQGKLDVEEISIPFNSFSGRNSIDNPPFKENKLTTLKNQVTVHTVSSQVYEN